MPSNIADIHQIRVYGNSTVLATPFYEQTSGFALGVTSLGLFTWSGYDVTMKHGLYETTIASNVFCEGTVVIEQADYLCPLSIDYGTVILTDVRFQFSGYELIFFRLARGIYG
jgi:hypothetical protein